MLSRNITLVTKGVLAVYPSIPYEDSLEKLKERFVKSEDPQLPVKMVELVLKNNILEFNGQIKQQLRDRIFKNARIAAAYMIWIYKLRFIAKKITYFNCDSKCLVYLITCRTCKPQYTYQIYEALEQLQRLRQKTSHNTKIIQLKHEL